ncbi:MAG: MBL fold metallo-hydrolase [Opitutaceae bacterium]
MEVIFLGTGTSQGVPMIGCDCAVCTSTDPRNSRTRTSMHIVMDGLHVQVDASPEFRLQCVREKIAQLDVFILTHGHADHLAGMDDLRRFCDHGAKAITVYATDEGRGRVAAMFPYAIGDRPVVKGYPAFQLADMPAVLEFSQGRISSTLLPHGAVKTLGLVFEEKSSGKKFAYFSDCKVVPAAAVALAQGAAAVCLDGLRPDPHPTHMSIEEACAAAAAIGCPTNYLTHMTHSVDHTEWSKKLPAGVQLAYDGLRLTL